MHSVNVTEISVTVGGECIFALDQQNESVVSTSRLIQGVLTAACLTNSPVTIERVGKTSVVQRIDAFSKGPKKTGDSSSKEPHLSRIATQKMFDGREEHLEVFLLKGADEKQYLIYDPSLQQLILAGFIASEPPPKTVTLTFDFDATGTDIVSVHLSSAPVPPPNLR